jgi:hypothetical protein
MILFVTIFDRPFRKFVEAEFLGGCPLLFESQLDPNDLLEVKAEKMILKIFQLTVF